MLINFLMDAAMLICAVRPVKRIRLCRIALAAAAGALGAGMIEAVSAGNTARLICAVCLAPLMALIACWPTGLRQLVGISASLMAVSALTAAIIGLIRRANVPIYIAAAVACTISGLVLARRRKWLSTWDARVDIRTANGDAAFNALIDSGNRLKEPISGLEVLIVEEKLVRALLPESFDPGQAWQSLPEGYRLISYGGVGGGGELACFMPERMFITNGLRRLDKSGCIWVAVYPGALPGRTGALAPPTAMQ